MPYSTIDRSSDYFRTKLYTGDGTTSRSITFDESKAMQPDFTWIKSRSNAYYHELYDVVRGFSSSTNGRVLYSNTTNAELTPNTFNSFNTNGFTVSLQSGEVGTNANGATFCAWNWKANGAGVSNTAGSISSTVSANTTSGFSVVSYTGTGANATVGHGLGVAPKMIIVKNRSVGSTDWRVGHQSLTWNNEIFLDLTNATNASSGAWNNTAPTSSVFSLGSGNYGNGSGNSIIAYCFAEVKGFSKFGSYTGNGSTDGTFVYTGFKPAFFLMKRYDSTGDWQLEDKSRLGYNPNNNLLFPNVSDAESSVADTDILSNGFKLRTTGTGRNASGGTYIYMAFAENPFVSSKGICTTAR